MIKYTAMLFRMKYIERWGLMRNARRETLSEHSADVAIVAGVLAAVANSEFAAGVSPERVMAAGVLHDCPEIITGDLPTPVKYDNAGIEEEYKKVERSASDRLLSMLPPDQRVQIEPLAQSAALSDRERRIVKAADILCALIKCREELRFGNSEFRSAARSTEARAAALGLPEVDYFLREYLPAHELDLDDLLSR